MSENSSSIFPKLVLMLLTWPLLLLDVCLGVLAAIFQWLTGTSKTKTNRSSNSSSVAVGKATATHSAPRRSPKSPDKLVESTETLYDMIQKAVKAYGPTTALASRKFVELKKLKPTDRFPSKIYDDSSLEKMTYTELGENVACFGAGLRTLGMEPIPQFGAGKSIEDAGKNSKFAMVIFEDTSNAWTIAFHGAISQSMVVSTCYATLGENAVIAAVNETGASCLLLNWKRVDEFAGLADKMPSLKTIIASNYEVPVDNPNPTFKNTNSRVQIVSFNDLIQLGKANVAKFPPVPPKSHDVAVIMYTSGSTGNPKGVVMKHSQVVSGVSGMAMNVHLQDNNEVNVSYLPLAHVLALQIENYLLSRGAMICHSDARELGKSLTTFPPTTVFAGVPKVYEIIQTQLLKTLGKLPAAVKVIFDSAFAWKNFLMGYGIDTPVTNVFFKALSKKVWGGVPRFLISGGGSLNASLCHFCRVVFCCPVVQGYALTETCVGGCFQALDDPRCDVVGPPVPCVEIMLQSEPDIKDGAGLAYLHTDKTSSKGFPIHGRGEICIRGPCISTGYYKLPDKTKAEYDKDGWFHTGDIGQFTDDGVIQIIDRKKNIVKLKGGEYVAVENMETAFGQSPFVSLVCVIANSDLDRPFAILMADKHALKEWASTNNVTYDSLKDLAGQEATRRAVIQSMVSSGKEAGLTKLELGVKDCVIVTDVEWGPGNGMTASMKLDRAKIFKMHADEISAMYQRNGVKQ